MAKNDIKTAYSLCYFFMIASFFTKQSQKYWDQCIRQQGCREGRGGGGEVEYAGERVGMEEGARGEDRYAKAQRPCTLMVIETEAQQVP